MVIGNFETQRRQEMFWIIPERVEYSIQYMTYMKSSYFALYWFL